MEVITIAGQATTRGNLDANGKLALLSNPCGIVCDKNGDIYFCESENHCIRVIHKNGEVKTLCGNGKAGFEDGIGQQARFHSPRDIAFDKYGNLIVADMDNCSIRKVTKEGIVSTICGGKDKGNFKDGPASQAAFYKPYGLCYDESDETIYICDTFNHLIRKIDKNLQVSTLCGSVGSSGSTDGKGTGAKFYWPVGIICDKKGGIIVADSGNHTIRSVTKDGVVSTLCGKAGTTGHIDGKGEDVRLNGPFTFAYDSNKILYFTEFHNHSIRTLNEDGEVKLLAGTYIKGAVDGPCNKARFYYPWGICFDSTTGNLVISDKENHTIRAILGVSPTLNFYSLDFLSLLQNSETVSDFQLSFRKRKYDLHQSILMARCPKIMGENDLSLLENIQDTHVDEAFEYLLKFLYGLPADMLQNLRFPSAIFLQVKILFISFIPKKMAQILDLEMLSSYCINLVTSQLTTGNVSTAFTIANDLGIKESIYCIRNFLKNQSSDFIQKFTDNHKLILEGPEVIIASAQLPEDSNMKQDMRKLYQSTLVENSLMKSPDFAIKIEGTTIFCHRSILYARCAFFKAMLSAHMQETIKGSISFPGAKEPSGMTCSSMKCLLLYFYTNDLEQIKEPVDALFILANSEYLRLTEENHQDLIEKCETALQENINEENCIDVLYFSDLLGATQATQFAWEFLCKNYSNMQKQLKEKSHLIPKELLIQDEALIAAINSMKM